MWGANGWHMMGYGGIGGLLLAILAIVAIVWAVRQLDRNGHGSGPPSTPGGPKEDSALKILRERFARGEIDAEEFEERKRGLRSEPGA